MLLKYLGTTAITINELPNEASVTVQPGQVIDVFEHVAQGLKDLYGASSWIDVDESPDNATLLSRTRLLTSTEIKALNTTPAVLIGAPGAGKAIVLERVISALDYNSAAYATNTDLEIRYDNATAGDAGGDEATMDSLDAILLETADAVYTTPGLGAAADTKLTINKGITAKVATGDPATGNSPLRLTVFYRIVTVA